MDQYNYCPHRLPCGICKETGSWCFYSNFNTTSRTEITCHPNEPYNPLKEAPITTPDLEIQYTNAEEK